MTRLSRRSLRFARVCAFATAAILATTASAGAIDDLQAFASQTKSARGRFVQKVQSRAKASAPASGDFVFARPGRFRWAYTKPYEQLLVADGETLTIYDRDLNQVTVRQLGDALGQTPAAILFGSADVASGFALKEAGTRDGIAWLEAVPKTRDTAFEAVRIGFRNGELAAMELRDALGQTTTLEFSDVERNPKIDPSTFVFKAPAGADVLRN